MYVMKGSPYCIPGGRRCVLETHNSGRNLVTWVVEPERGMDALCCHSGVSPIPGSRTRPDGTSIHWRGAAVEQVCQPLKSRKAAL